MAPKSDQVKITFMAPSLFSKSFASGFIVTSFCTHVSRGTYTLLLSMSHLTMAFERRLTSLQNVKSWLLFDRQFKTGQIAYRDHTHPKK